MSTQANPITTANPYEEAGRERKAARLALWLIDQAGGSTALAIATARRATLDHWLDAAKRAGVNVPSSAAIVRTIEILESAAGAADAPWTGAVLPPTPAARQGAGGSRAKTAAPAPAAKRAARWIREVVRSLPCAECDGSGRVTVGASLRSEACRRCDGERRITIVESNCTVCGTKVADGIDAARDGYEPCGLVPCDAGDIGYLCVGCAAPHRGHSRAMSCLTGEASHG